MQQRVNQKPRIVIYGVGQFGQTIVRIANQKAWPIVAAFNRAGKKVGQDIGRLSGLDKDTGVLVQDCDLANYDHLDADVAIVTTTDRLSKNFPAYKRLMSGGLNILCIAGEAIFPFGFDKELASKIDALAKKNNVTFTGTGIWDQSRIWSGIMVTGPCTEIDSLYHKSVTDVQRAGLDIMLANGVSATQEQYQTNFVDKRGAVGGLFPSILQHVLTAIGYTITTVSERLEPVFSDEPVHCKLLKRDLEPGICLGTCIAAMAETREGVNARADIELRIIDETETEHMMWEVKGMPSTKIRIERDDSAHATASSLFNRIPDVIKAPPGIQEISKLGLLKHTALQ